LWPTRLKSTGVCRKSLFSKPALEASIKQPKENIILTSDRIHGLHYADYEEDLNET
jgi:hypothetical protein